jgi:PAS domain S-box-containing protein
MSLSYRTQFSLMLLMGSAILLAILGSLFYYMGTNEINERFKNSALFKANTIVQQFQDYTKMMSLTVESLAESDSLTQFITAKENKDTLQEHVRSLFLVLMKKHPEFMQLRYIDAKGHEMIRFDRNHNSSEQPYEMASPHLQNKGHRGYFIETSKLEKGGIWFSKLDLNIEHKRIEIPIKPTLRASTPVYINGSFQGIIIVNVLVKELLENIKQFVDDMLITLVDQEGEIIIHPNSQLSWSRYLKQAHHLKDDFPEQTLNILTHERWMSTTFISHRLGLENGENLTLILEMDKRIYDKQFDYVKKITLLIVSVLFFIFLFVNVFLSRVMASIPEKLEKEVEKRTRELADKQNELHRQLVFQKTLLKTIPNPIFFKDEEGIYRECNCAFQTFLGLKKEEIIGHNIYDLIAKEQADVYHQADLKLKENGEVQTYEAKVLHAKGHERNIIFNEAVMINGEFGGIIGVMLDVTELKAVQERLALTNEKLAQSYAKSEKMVALGQLIAGVAHEINTPLGAIRSAVMNITRFLTQTLEQLPPFFQLLSKERQHDFFILLQNTNERELNLSSKEKRQYRRALIHQLEKQGILESASMADTLVEMGIYQNLDPFLALLKDTNGSTILNIAYMLSTLQQSTKTITMASGRATKTVQALKNFARYDNTGQKVNANITEGIETVLTLYYNQLKQGVEIIRNYADLPAILCYPDELNQVWTNLIHNALQAMDNKGILEIDVFILNNQMLISITDNGCGIPEDIQSKIFEPFFTTKPAGEGSGLGLDIVKKIIDKHDGKITITSVPGKTNFTVYLPI